MKKRSILITFLSLILTFSVSIGLTTVAYAQETPIEYSMGDANLDGNVNTRDVVLIKQSIVGLTELTDQQKVFADVYADGQINTRDVVLIQQYIVGMDVDLGLHEHTFENGVCICGYVEPHTHDYTTLKYSTTEHWYECTCGDKSGVEGHKGGKATCTEKAVCEECNTVYGEPNGHDYKTQVVAPKCEAKGYTIYTCHCGDTYNGNYVDELGHSYGAWVSNGNDTHIKTCANDNGHKITESCKGGEATCIEKAVCEDCNTAYGETLSHNFEKSICAVCGFSNLAFELSENGSYYIVSGIGECEETEIIIPSSYNDKPVKTVASNAFRNCTLLTSVVIPDGVENIGNGAFYKCSSLESVVIGNSVGDISAEAFYGYSNLESVEIPDSVTSIGPSAFSSCDSLENVVIGDGVTSIGNSAFCLCKSLTNVEYKGSLDSWAEIWFGDYSSNPVNYAKKLLIDGKEVTEVNLTTATKINAYAFYNFDSITKIIIGDSVESIGYCAFYNCTSLTSIVIPESVINIGSEAFNNCESLANVEYKANIDSWAEIEFGTYSSNPVYYAKKLLIDGKEVTEVNLTKATKINAYAFYNFASITRVVIGDSIENIGERAFYRCDRLTSLVLGKGVTNVGDDAFNLCYRLVEVVNRTSTLIIKGSSTIGHVGYYALMVDNCDCEYDTKLSNDNGYIVFTDGEEKILVGYFGEETDLTLPSYITEIYKNAFIFCSYTSVVIPKGVTGMHDYTFLYCDGITAIYCEAESQYGSWESNWNYTNYPVYWYRENYPSTTGNYWHYDKKGEIKLWSDHVHAYEEQVIAPTCTKQGYTLHACDCGDSYNDNYVDALGHDYEWVITAPTCEEQGYTTYTCHCGENYVADYVGALGHSFANYIYNGDATCDIDGTETATCNRDGCTKTSSRVKANSALGHNYGDWVSNGDNTHIKTCTNDNSHTITENCSGGTATYLEKAVCDSCHKEYGNVQQDKENVIGFRYAKTDTKLEATLSLGGKVKVCGFEAIITFNTVGLEFDGVTPYSIIGVDEVEYSMLSNGRIKLLFYESQIEDITTKLDIIKISFKNVQDNYKVDFSIDVNVFVDSGFKSQNYNLLNNSFGNIEENLNNVLSFSYKKDNTKTQATLSLGGIVKVCGFEAIIKFDTVGAEYSGITVGSVEGVDDIEYTVLSDGSIKLFFYQSQIEDITQGFDIITISFNNTEQIVDISFEVDVSVFVDSEFQTQKYLIINTEYKG